MTNKPNNPSPPSHLITQTNGTTTLSRKNVVSLPGLHSRLRNPVQRTEGDPQTRPNRLALVLDVSGSMAGDKIASLRDACASFVNACNFGDTSLAVEPFGDTYPSANRLGLTVFQPLALTTVMSLQSHGSTPMARALDFVLNSYSITRAVLVSDGQPDHEQSVYDSAEQYKQAELPIDTVHIGDEVSGEQVLQRVAEITGGQFIKFTDINAFARSFKYLTPAYYGQLTSGNVTAEQLGAKEIK
jgi:Mg-chelatase subunit ChlD